MARPGISRIVALLASCVLVISGCTNFYVQSFAGHFVKSGRRIAGDVVFRIGHKGIGLSLGSMERQECEGQVEVTKEGKSLFGIRLTSTVFHGKIACLDGRFGHYQLVSQGQWSTGQMSGEIGGEPFVAKMTVQGDSCDLDSCDHGPHWTNENEKKDSEIYCKVWAEHGLSSPTSLCMNMGN